MSQAVAKRAYEIPGVLLERARLDGPVLAGQLWEGTGTAGHQRGMKVTVVRLSAAGRVIFTKEKRFGGRTYTLDEPTFRTCYTLVKQAPLTERNAEALAFAVSAAIIGQGDAVVEATKREGRVMNVVDDLRTGAAPAAPTPPVPPEPPEPPETPQNGHQPPTVVAASPVVPDGPQAPAPDAQEAQDPLEAFVAHGLTTLERLDAEVRRLGEDRELTRLELEELDAKLADARRRWARASRGIEAALAAIEEPPEPPPPLPASATVTAKLPGTPSIDDRAIEGGVGPTAGQIAEYATRRHISKVDAARLLADQDRRTRAPIAAVGQRDFFEAFVLEQRRFSFNDLLTAHIDRYGMSPEQAGKRVAGYLADRTKRPRPGAPVLVRLSPGQYQLQDAPHPPHNAAAAAAAAAHSAAESAPEVAR